MIITRATEYAVRCVLYLTIHRERPVVGRREIARAMSIPEHFLGKIAQGLSRAGIIRITRGPRGGYSLLMAPEQLSLLAVVEAAGGNIFLNECIMDPSSCTRSSTCGISRVWARAREGLRSTLAASNFAQLAVQEVCSIVPAEGKGRLTPDPG